MRAFFKELLFQFHCWRLERMRARWRAKHYPVAMLPSMNRETTLGYAPKSLKAFTLLELLVSVGIVAILAAIAIPAYANYSTKAAASEGLRLAEAATTAAVSSFQDTGKWPLTNTDAGYSPQAGKYVSSVNMDGNGNVAIQYGNAAPAPLNGTLLFLEPWLAPDNATVMWTCGIVAGPPTVAAGTNITAGTATALFATSAIGASTTPVQFLPKNCHQ